MNPLSEDLDHILTHTAGVWESIRGQNIFITGGTGFFGRWLLESFAEANRRFALGARAVVLSRDPAAFAAKAPNLAGDEAISFVRGDVRTFTAEDIRGQLGSGALAHYRFVIHAATDASARLNTENPLLMLDTVVQGTRAALEFAVRSGTERFLLTSSGAVYGQQPSEMTHVTEEYRGAPDPTDAASAYGEGKRMAELLCACFAREHRIEPLIARCFAFVGPFLPLDAHFAIGNFIRDALRGGPIMVNGDGTPYRSYLYAADLAIWLWTILVNGNACRPYNVGSEDGRPIREIADVVRAVSSSGAVRIGGSGTHRPAQRYVPSCRRAATELGLVRRIEITDAILRTLHRAAG